MTTETQNIVTVSSAVELLAALEAAQGGETILLEAGNYGELNLWIGRETFSKFASEVTITSADPDNLASFDRVKLDGVENLTFDNILFDYDAAPGTPYYDKPFSIWNSQGITVRDATFDGDLAEDAGALLDGYGTGIGLYVRNSSDIVVDNNLFYNWNDAAQFDNITGLDVVNNEVHSSRVDGFQFVRVNDVLIESNYLHDFKQHPDGTDHMDMIQFWTQGTSEPSTNITIRANILDSGGGNYTQSIFIRNEEVDLGRAGLEMYYQNILIEDNVIHNSHAHGITVGETAGLTVQNNTILHNRDTGDEGLVNVPTINVKDTSLDVLIAGNIVPRLGIESGFDRIVENNLVVQSDDPAGDNYVGDLFVNGLAGSLATLDDLRGRPDGLVEQLGVGSSPHPLRHHPGGHHGIRHRCCRQRHGTADPQPRCVRAVRPRGPAGPVRRHGRLGLRRRQLRHRPDRQLHLAAGRHLWRDRPRHPGRRPDRQPRQDDRRSGPPGDPRHVRRWGGRSLRHHQRRRRRQRGHLRGRRRGPGGAPQPGQRRLQAQRRTRQQLRIHPAGRLQEGRRQRERGRHAGLFLLQLHRQHRR
jgi:parallel beta-helix repeat protein